MSEKLAKILSIMFQPIFIPLYGLLLLYFDSDFYGGLQQLDAKIISLSIVAFFNVILPALFYKLLEMIGVITTPQATDRRERYVIYLLTVVCYYFGAFVLFYFGVYHYFVMVMLSAAICLTLVAIINLFWKISAHMCGIGGLLGAVMYVSWFFNENIWILYSIIILAAASVACARLVLKQHTPAQIVAGFMLGLVGMFAFPLILV